MVEMRRGIQVILDAQAKRGLQDRRFVEDWIREAVELADLRIRGFMSIEFAVTERVGPGVSVQATIETSHICVHTWPEYEMVTMDFYSCDPDTNRHIKAVRESFFDAFQVPKVLKEQYVGRWAPAHMHTALEATS